MRHLRAALIMDMSLLHCDRDLYALIVVLLVAQTQDDGALFAPLDGQFPLSAGFDFDL